MESEKTSAEVSADEISLHTILRAIQNQGDINSKLRSELAELKNEVHGFSLAVASQVKKLKVDQEYKWRYEGKKVQFLLNSEILDDLAQINSAIENSKFEYARETVNDLTEKVKKRNKFIKIADSSEAAWDIV